jgi:hypothetical protein
MGSEDGSTCLSFLAKKASSPSLTAIHRLQILAFPLKQVKTLNMGVSHMVILIGFKRCISRIL